MRHALYISSMENNIIPTFLIAKAGILVNGVARIHYIEDLSHKIHSVIAQEEYIELRFPLRLDGIFSYLLTQSITPEDIEKIDHVEVIFLTPDLTSWYLYYNSYE